MPHCSNCSKSQARFKNDGSLCTTCFNECNSGQVKSRNNNNIDINVMPPQLNVDVSPSNRNDASSVISPLEMQKKVGDITTGELLGLFQQIIKPLEKKIDLINTALSVKIISLEKRVDTLEKEDNVKNGRILQLADTVVNMQRALNSIDSKDRANNVIMLGLTEEDMTVDGILLSGDAEKIKFIFRKINIGENIINLPSTSQRIGRDINGEKRRALKIILKDYDTREIIMENARKLKAFGDPLDKVYINRDTHPVYQKENQRLRKKFNDLKKRADLQQEPNRVKLTKGLLTLDDVTIDRNIFLK